MPPPDSSGASSAFTSRSRNWSCDFFSSAADAPGLMTFANSSGCVSSSQPNTSSGNSARSLSYPSPFFEYNHPCACQVLAQFPLELALVLLRHVRPPLPVHQSDPVTAAVISADRRSFATVDDSLCLGDQRVDLRRLLIEVRGNLPSALRPAAGQSRNAPSLVAVRSPLADAECRRADCILATSVGLRRNSRAQRSRRSARERSRTS